MKSSVVFRLLLTESKKTVDGYPIVASLKNWKRLTGFVSQKSYWNTRKRRLNATAPLALSINAELDKLQKQYDEALDELKDENPTLNDLPSSSKCLLPANPIEVNSLFLQSAVY